MKLIIPYVHYYHCIFIAISFLPNKSFCTDPKYEACLPKYCGNHTISFPFYIEDKQESYCGHPGFNLTCIKNEYPILKIAQDAYRVDEISYANRSLRLSNAASWNRCILPQIRNLSLQGYPLELSNNLKMVLLKNCSFPSPPEKFWEHVVFFCEDEGYKGNWGLAMNEADTKLSDGIKGCNDMVVAPVRDDHVYEISKNNYVELLRKGFDLKWTASDCGECEAGGGHCGFDAGPSYQLECYCPDGPHSRTCKPTRKGSKRLILEIAIPGAGLIFFLVIIIIMWRCKKWNNLIPMIVGTAAACVVILIVLLCCFWSKCSSCKTIIFGKYGRKDHENVDAFLRNYGPLVPKRYRYQDVKKMTNSFKCKVGQGGYGGVYKGKLHDGRDVAVKILNKLKGDGEEFVNEVASISRTSHINIVTLLGFCFEGSKRALIYEFMPNGSLEKFLPNEKSTAVRQLGWETLYQIALGIARGLEYLHRGCNTRILHFDIKPHNILLDEEFCPKISDFGLAKLCFGKDSVISMLGMRGTPGYIAPEVFSRNFGGISHKSDVYSYGMMILEMAGGKKNIPNGVDRSTEEYFPKWIYSRLELKAEIGLDGIWNEVENESTRKMLIVGLWCIQTNPSNRPSMKRVLEMLEGGLESLQIPPRPFFDYVPEPLAYSSTTC